MSKCQHYPLACAMYLTSAEKESNFRRRTLQRRQTTFLFGITFTAESLAKSPGTCNESKCGQFWFHVDYKPIALYASLWGLKVPDETNSSSLILWVLLSDRILLTHRMSTRLCPGHPWALTHTVFLKLNVSAHVRTNSILPKVDFPALNKQWCLLAGTLAFNEQ